MLVIPKWTQLHLISTSSESCETTGHLLYVLQIIFCNITKYNTYLTMSYIQLM